MRRVRLAILGAAAAIAVVGAAVLLLPLAVRALVRAVALTLCATMLPEESRGSGAGAWTIATTVASAGGGVMVTTPALIVLMVLVVVGGMAVYALQRLLGADQEQSR